MLGVLAAGGDPTSVQGGLLRGFDYPSLDFEISLAGEYNGTVEAADQVVLPPHSTVFPRGPNGPGNQTLKWWYRNFPFLFNDWNLWTEEDLNDAGLELSNPPGEGR